jgi:hypothetical protein
MVLGMSGEIQTRNSYDTIQGVRPNERGMVYMNYHFLSMPRIIDSVHRYSVRCIQIRIWMAWNDSHIFLDNSAPKIKIYSSGEIIVPIRNMKMEYSPNEDDG